MPLSEVTSRKAFTADLTRCRTVDLDLAENSVDLTTAAPILAIADLLRRGREQAKEAPVLLETGLKDAAAELTKQGLRVLVSRYVGRHFYGRNKAELSGVGLHVAMVCALGARSPRRPSDTPFRSGSCSIGPPLRRAP